MGNSPSSLLLFSFQKEKEKKKSPGQSRGSWENRRPHRERRQPQGLVNPTPATSAHEIARIAPTLFVNHVTHL
jgi:hypothetical protein